MQASTKAILFGSMLAAALPAFAADKTPAAGNTVCKWVGDEKVCTTYHQKAKTYGNGFLRPEEVKQCLLDKRRMAANDAQLASDKAKLEPESAGVTTETAKLQKTADDLQADGKKLEALHAEVEKMSNGLQKAEPTPSRVSRFGSSDGNSDEGKAEAYNKKVAEYNKTRDAYNAKIAAYNEAVNVNKDSIAKHNAAANDINGRLQNLKAFAADFDKRCAQAKSYEDDVKAAEAAIAKDDAAAQKK